MSIPENNSSTRDRRFTKPLAVFGLLLGLVGLFSAVASQLMPSNPFGGGQEGDSVVEGSLTPGEELMSQAWALSDEWEQKWWPFLLMNVVADITLVTGGIGVLRQTNRGQHFLFWGFLMSLALILVWSVPLTRHNLKMMDLVSSEVTSQGEELFDANDPEEAAAAEQVTAFVEKAARTAVLVGTIAAALFWLAFYGFGMWYLWPREPAPLAEEI